MRFPDLTSCFKRKCIRTVGKLQSTFHVALKDLNKYGLFSCFSIFPFEVSIQNTLYPYRVGLNSFLDACMSLSCISLDSSFYSWPPVCIHTINIWPVGMLWNPSGSDQLLVASRTFDDGDAGTLSLSCGFNSMESVCGLSTAGGRNCQMFHTDVKSFPIPVSAFVVRNEFRGIQVFRVVVCITLL